MSNKIEIFENTLLKLLVRQGINADRKVTLLSEGELGYTIDTERLFIGNGSDLGGVLVGNKMIGSFSFTSPNIAEVGDILFNTSTNTLFTLKSGDGGVDTDWDRIGNVVVPYDGSINFTADNQISVGSLSANSISEDALGNSLEIDGSGRVALSASITTNNIDILSTNPSDFLGLPKNLSINSVDYIFPTTTPVQGEILTCVNTGSGTNLEWVAADNTIVYIPATPENSIPVGSVIVYSASAVPIVAPSGWLECDGSSVAIATYPDLYSVIGDSFGATVAGEFLVPAAGDYCCPLSGSAYLIKHSNDLYNSNITVSSPLTATMDGVDITDTATNPLEGDLVIGRASVDTARTAIFTATSGTEVSFIVPENIEKLKVTITGAGGCGWWFSGAASGSSIAGGSAGATASGYLHVDTGQEIIVRPGRSAAFSLVTPLSAASEYYGDQGESSYIKINSIKSIECEGGHGGGSPWTIGANVIVNETNSYVSSDEIISLAGGIGQSVSNAAFSTYGIESSGGSSYWGGIPAYGAGGITTGLSQRGAEVQDIANSLAIGGDGIVIFEW